MDRKFKKPIIEYSSDNSEYSISNEHSNDYSEYLFIIPNIRPIIPIIHFFFKSVPISPIIRIFGFYNVEKRSVTV